MRVFVDIESGPGDELHLRVTAPDLEHSQPVTWLEDRLLVARHMAGAVEDPPWLADAVECCDTDGDAHRQLEQLQRLREYGELLFNAAFGQAEWQKILAAVPAGMDYLEIAVRGAAGGGCALQALRWEALHDGTGFVVAQGVTYQGRSIPVGVVRLITPSGAGGGQYFQPITHIPKVLFAVGSHLTDQDVRSGAEFMGIMRRLDRDGGSVRARLLERATRAGLVAELAAFKPDFLHIIGHGELLDDEQVKVQLRSEADGDHYVSAEELLGAFAEAAHWPAMVVLSACRTAAAGGGQLSALPFAARLVAGNSVSRGVPIVAAMAGDISDTACRLFTQALTTAVGDGALLGKAVVRGRRAAFFSASGTGTQHPAPDSGHWVMPTVFAADFVPGDVPLVLTGAAEAARRRVRDLYLFDDPVFYGRTSFLTALDQLLDADEDLNILVAFTSNPNKSYGGMRLLRELGARAVRSGVLPVLLGEFGDDDGPQDLAALAAALEGRINEIRADLLGLGKCRSEAVAAAGRNETGIDLAMAIRRDLDALVAALPEDDPVRNRGAGQPRTILLCHRVNGWNALDDLLDLLGPHGLRGGTTPVPVVLTGADVRPLKEARERRRWGPTRGRFMKLRRFQRDGDWDEDGEYIGQDLRNEDILAFQWWLLNPPVAPDGQQRAFAPRRGTPGDDWKNTLRIVLDDKNVIYHPLIYTLAGGLSCLVSACDDALLASFAQVLT
jgi:hypothetical protein